VWWLWAARGHLPGRRLLLALAVVKLAAGGAFLVERGLWGRYFAGPGWTGPVERSVDFLQGPRTRVDPRLAFHADRAPTLPVHYLNDVLLPGRRVRLNYWRPGEPARTALPVSARWEAWVPVGADTRARVYLAGRGVRADLAVDGRVALALGPEAARAETEVALPAGWRHLAVRLDVPLGAPRGFEAGWLDPAGRPRPLDAAMLFPVPVAPRRLAADRAVRRLSAALDGGLLGLLAWWTVLAAVQAAGRLVDAARARGTAGGAAATAGQALAWLAALADAFRFAHPAAGHAVVLSGGDDWLFYEARARDLLFHGPLLTFGAPLGEGQPFWNQPFYPYLLAAAHLALGEDLFGPFLLQRLAVAVTAWATWRLTALLFGRGAGWAALALGVPFLYLTAGELAGVLLTETAFIPLTAAAVLALTRLAAGGPAPGAALRAGLLGGLAAIIRSSFLAAWLPGLALAAWAWRGRPRAAAALALLVAGTLLPVAGTAARNWAVARQLVLIERSGLNNVRLGNPPPPTVTPPPGPRARLYARLGLSPGLAAVAEYAIQQPGAFLAGLGTKARYAAGCFDAMGGSGGILHSAPPHVVRTPAGRWPVAGCSVLYGGVGILAAAGGLLVLAGGAAAGATGPARLVPAAAGLGHLAAVVLAFPHVYGDRLPLPGYVLLLPYAAVALAAGAALVRRGPGQPPGPG
jgi:hypothetical protein